MLDIRLVGSQKRGVRVQLPRNGYVGVRSMFRKMMFNEGNSNYVLCPFDFQKIKFIRCSKNDD